MCKTNKACVMGAAAAGLLVVILVIALPIALQDDEAADYASAGRQVSPEVVALLKSSIFIDGHNDLPHNMRRLAKNQLHDLDFSKDVRLQDSAWNCSACHTDIPRLRKGLISGQFWVAYVKCSSEYKDAVEQTLEQIDVIKRFISQYPKDLQFVKTAKSIEDSFHRGKIASLLCVEGGHSIDSRLAVLRLYYELGVRYMTLTHSCNTPWATASPEDEKNVTKKGLSEFGKIVVKEMNRLGMMVDLSHVSYQTMLDAISVSKAPAFFSHSSAWAVCNHHRNVRDDVLRLVAKGGGIVMVNYYSRFIQCKNETATIDTIVEHINHIRKVAGVNNIGIGADFDGVDEMPEGVDDVSSHPFIFERLLNPKEGEPKWTKEELQKLAGRNFLRVFHEVERVRDEMAKSGVKPYEDLIPTSDLGENTECRTELN